MESLCVFICFFFSSSFFFSNISVWLPLTCPLLGTWPTTQACALTGNRTSDTLLHRMALDPLSHASRGRPLHFKCGGKPLERLDGGKTWSDLKVKCRILVAVWRIGMGEAQMTAGRSCFRPSQRWRRCGWECYVGRRRLLEGSDSETPSENELCSMESSKCATNGSIPAAMDSIFLSPPIHMLNFKLPQCYMSSTEVSLYLQF